MAPRGITNEILTSKLTPPRGSAEWVVRPRLLARLREGNDVPLVLLSAPAGTGKTALLSQWVKSRRGPVSWLTLDRRDDEPRRFLVHLAATIPEVSEALSPFVDRPQGPDYLLDAFEGWIEFARRSRRQPRILLDDFQQVANPRIHEALEHAISSPGSTLRFLIATRVDPPFPLARWRANGTLVEVREPDLRFRPDETEAFIDRWRGPELSEASRRALEERTDGWIAGLKLACLSLRETDDPDAFIAGFSGVDRHVLDYFFEEVLEHLDRDTVRFLRRVSILDSICAPLCDQVTDLPDARARLEELDRANLFVRALDPRREWYRIHPLLNDLLRMKLRRAEPELEPLLHARASLWFEVDGEVEEAASHALAAGDPERAARLVEPTLEHAWSFGHIETIEHWLTQLPPEVVEVHSELALHASWSAFLSGDAARSASLLATAEAHLDEDPSHAARAALLRSHHLRLAGDLEGSITHARSALTADLPDALDVRTEARISLAMAKYAQGAARESLTLAEEALEGGHILGSAFYVIVSRMTLGMAQLARGRLAAARDSFALSIEGSRQSLVYDPVFAYALDARILRERDDLEGASARLEEAERLAEKLGRDRILVELPLEAAFLSEARGDRDRADAMLLRAEEVGYHVRGGPVRDRVAAWRAHFALGRGDVERAEQWERERLEEYPEAAVPGVPERGERVRLNRVRIGLARGTVDGAMEALSENFRRAERDGRARGMLESEILQARVRRAQGQHDQALPPILRALSAAADEGFVRVFVDEGIEVEELVRRARSQGHEVEFCDRLLDSFERARGSSTTPTLSSPLTAREKDVLVRIESGLSNREIARALHVSESTVKTHVNRLYRKLGVTRRTQAIAIARDLRLL